MSNPKCPGWIGRLKKNGNEVLNDPKIVAIYCWTSLSWTHVEDYRIGTEAMDLFLTRLVSGSLMDGLAQYGVNRGQFLTSTVESITEPNSITQDDLQNFLKVWISSGDLPAPVSMDDPGTLYFIFLPPGVTVTQSNGEVSGVDFAAYHDYGHYNESDLSDSNLFWVVIPWPTPVKVPPAATDYDSLRAFFKNLVDNLTQYCGHELAEACSDRDQDGYKDADGCEIGDVCFGTKAKYLGWKVEKYYSDAHQSCIGPPVNGQRSLRQCLKMNGMPESTSLRAINPFATSLADILATT